MIDIYYCKFFTIKHRGLHTVYLTHSFVYTVHTASRDNRPVYTGTWCMVHYIYMCLYCGIFPTVEQKIFFLKLVKTLMSIGSARDNLNMHITGIPDM